MKKPTNYTASMKYSVENNIKYSADSFNPTKIGYDIETYHPTDKTVIPTHLNGGVMSMITAVYSRSDRLDGYKVYILN